MRPICCADIHRMSTADLAGACPRDWRDVATPAGQFRPWRLILTFIGIVVVLYGLVFFTPGPNTPKLGIDLQGGTRITLTARTQDGSDPTRDQMQQARTIMENRVNGSGVSGAEVQIDGTKNLVITVVGNEDLSGLTRSAQMNIRPVLTSPLGDASGTPVISYPAGYTPPTSPAASGAATSGSVTGSADASATAPLTTIPAIGDTTPASVPGGAETVAPAAPTDATTAPETTAAETSPAGLRAPQQAIAAPGDTTDASPTA